MRLGLSTYIAALLGCVGLFASTSSIAAEGDDAFAIGGSLGVPIQQPVLTAHFFLGYEPTDWFGVTLNGRFAPRDPGVMYSGSLNAYLKGSYKHVYGLFEVGVGVFGLGGRPIDKDMLTLFVEPLGEVGYASDNDDLFIGIQGRVLIAPTGGVLMGANNEIVRVTPALVFRKSIF